MLRKLIATAALIGMSATAAFAHSTLEVTEAHVGASYKAVIRVPHGCEGKPTIAVRVQVPEGMIAAKPMPKPGWTVEKIKGAYEKSYDYFGTPMKDGVKEIVWKGGSLADDEYDEFVFRAFVTDSLPVGNSIYVPIVQECTDGATERWIEIPAAGKSSDDLEFPAPGIKLLEKKSGH
ncbi:YcnI family protein [Ensifer adhaerens]|uniref:YcnI family copper-binding membrane protein n=1 Tax=Ensifer adhaerens TaxID=106592 RepID=UPI00098F610E|nr:YcnI family protein [Ensifer adhaerens]